MLKITFFFNLRNFIPFTLQFNIKLKEIIVSIFKTNTFIQRFTKATNLKIVTYSIKKATKAAKF